MNIPLERFKSEDAFLTQQEFKTLLKNNKSKTRKSNLVVSMFFFTDDIDNKIFWDCLSVIREIIVDLQLCKSSKLIVIVDNLQDFAQQFPFLLTSVDKENENLLEKQLKSKENNNSSMNTINLVARINEL